MKWCSYTSGMSLAARPRPMKELKGFQRVHLAAGESKKITFHLPVDQLAFINNDLELVLEAGKVFLLVGGSSEDIDCVAVLRSARM